MATRQPRAPSRRTALALCLAPCLTLCAATAAQAQAPQEDKWPTRPVRIVVGFPAGSFTDTIARSEEHTSELQSQSNLVCRLLLEKKKKSYQEPLPNGHGHRSLPRAR